MPMTVLAAVGAGLMAGLLFAFSNFIMKALMRLPPEQGMAAMQHINITILNPVFVLLFFGTAVLCGVLACYSLLQWKSACSPWLLAGSALYLAGPIGVTLVVLEPHPDPRVRRKRPLTHHRGAPLQRGVNSAAAPAAFLDDVLRLAHRVRRVHVGHVSGVTTPAALPLLLPALVSRPRLRAVPQTPPAPR